MESDTLLCEDYVQNLVDNVTNNCKNVEELALGEINARHIPLINSTLCLTNEDCRNILDKCQQCDNVLEKSVLLIALTDFISCVCANSETFPLEGKKKETKRIALLMQALKNSWGKLFSKLSAKDITVNQMTGITTVVKRCLERIPPNRTYKVYLEVILKMTDKALHMLLKPPEVKNIHSNSSKKSSKYVTQLKSGTIPKVHASPETVPVNRHVEQTTENKGKVKPSYDITKFILKPCENVMQENVNEKEGKNLACKRKFEEIEAIQTPAKCKEMERDNVTLVETDEAPPAKRHCVHDDVINGKMNAFKMLMKPRKSNSQLGKSRNSLHTGVKE